MNLCDADSVRLSRQERILLCNDICRFSLLLGHESHVRVCGSVAAETSPDPGGSPQARLSLLRDLWPRIEAALHTASASPDMAAIRMPRAFPIGAVRGGPATVSQLARSAALQRAWTQTVRQTPSDPAALIREPRPAHTMLTPANRVAAGFLSALEQEVQALHRLALFCEESAAITAAGALCQRIGHWRRQSPFCDSDSSATSGPSLPPEVLLRSAPPYRSLYEAIRRSRSGLQIDWSESSVLRFPLLEAWHLYEIWCFLQVGFALRGLGWQPFESDCLAIVQDGLRLRLARGKASRMRFRASRAGASRSDHGDVLELVYQPQFVGANQTFARTPEGFHSLSHVMQPDIALVRDRRMLLLDPKYRPYGEVGAEQEDVDKMHAYRDAIVAIDARTGRTVPAVDAAWCLFPGLPGDSGEKPEPLRAYPASTPGRPFGTAGVGAVQVRPGAQNAELSALLRRWLESESELS
jgi:hypothetical protein